MPLLVSGTISLSQVNTELSRPAAQAISLNDAAVRALAVKASGTISMSDLRGKSAGRVAAAFIYTTHQLNGAIILSNMAGYVAGKTDVTITINAGVYMYSDSAAPALNIIGGVTGDTVTLINNGFIMGKGGNGQYWSNPTNGVEIPSTPGYTALQIAYATTINTLNGYIGGGGGAGGGLYSGGGGAGGGRGAAYDQASAGVGGGIGAAGGNGSAADQFGNGGGGGRIMPGVGGVARTLTSTVAGPGFGGGAGGGGGIYTIYGSYPGGGGGGWGAAGGSCPGYNDGTVFGTQRSGVGGSAGAVGGNSSFTGSTIFSAGGAVVPTAGGKAISTQGRAVTLVGASAARIYGIIG
jgi:hypothetical protein